MEREKEADLGILRATEGGTQKREGERKLGFIWDILVGSYY